jgi:glycolate oxidase iron-sulfur subunit
MNDALPPLQTPHSPAFPLGAADLCVKCGLCLPHCPTYGQTQHEGDSPRGRISLMQGLATGALSVTPKLEAHLDGCLSCRACERVCPAKVPYGELIDAGRALLATQKPERTRITRLTGAVLSSSAGLRVLQLLLWLYRSSGIQHLIRASSVLGRGRLARLESLIPERRYSALSPAPAATQQETISLFTGCVGRLVDTPTLHALQRLFQHMGYRVDIPSDQGCCGAIHEHGGLPDGAARNVARNLQAFAASSCVVHSASGCGATLVDYARLTEDRASGAAFVRKLDDACGALLRRWPAQLNLLPLKARVAVHLPCTQRNVLGGTQHILDLLRKIPEIELVELDATHQCCGAAGTYFVTQPQMADQLLQRKLNGAALLQPDYIVSTNIGCSLHIAGGLRRRGGGAPEVLHPATLLARQLPP